jgi:hypothetical protein
MIVAVRPVSQFVAQAFECCGIQELASQESFQGCKPTAVVLVLEGGCR